MTQTARYFKEEADAHETSSSKWLLISCVAAFLVLAFSISSLFLFDCFAPNSIFESAQLVASKLLIFFVLAYALIQCVRNYSAHKHNAVTNRHRQNALMTYKTLAEAGNTPELRDAVLQHAAAAIYSPNDSGYLKGEERGYGGQSLVALAARNLTTGGGSSP